MASLSNSKSKSPAPGSRPLSNSKPCTNGGYVVPSRVSWKHLRKQYPWLKQLRKHQERGTEAIVSTAGFAALYEQRTGKTWVTGAALCVTQDQSHDVLLVGQKTNLRSTWEKFVLDKLPWYTVHHDLKSYDEHKKAWKKAWGDTPQWNILILNPEKITPIRDKLARRGWDVFIWDECQRLKNRASQASRDAALIGKRSKRRWGLSGTPMDADPKDLWALMRFIAPDVLGERWGDFEDEYLEKPTIDLTKKMGVIQRQKVLLAHQIAKRKAPFREDKKDQFAAIVQPYLLRITKEDAGIQRANVHIVKFNLDPQEAERYRRLEKDMLVKTKGITIKTPLKITQIVKLQQLTGGHIKDEEGEVHRTGTTKRRIMRKLILDNIGKKKPFVVFCKFVWEVHMIARMLERMGLGEGAKLWGKVKDGKRDKRRTDMLLDFQKGRYRWIVCQQKTGGVGVDLYFARKYFVYSMGYSYIDYDQMLSRGDFLEQKQAADFFFPLVRSSIDTDIMTGVKKKKSVTQLFYDRLNR